MAGLYHHPPLFVVEGSGALFQDVDGHTYLDMNQADLSMNCGYGPVPVVAAGSEHLRQGSQFLLPSEDAIVVSELLAERFGIPFGQDPSELLRAEEYGQKPLHRGREIPRPGRLERQEYSQQSDLAWCTIGSVLK